LDKINSLTPFIVSVACQKATEHPFSGRFLKVSSPGTYLCRRCGLPLWETQHQFPSHCGWPSFDDRNSNAIDEIPDADGMRTEIICHRCQSHLGHVFRGEGFTEKNQRDCVNSVMLDFVPETGISDTEEAILAGGCFWGVEYWIARIPGVLLTECGYTGGDIDYPSYEQVCSSDTGHFEALRVVFNPKQVSLNDIYQHFFEIHDPTQKFGQGPDIGHQYQSAIFYYDDIQKNTAQQLIKTLESKGFKVQTQLKPIQVFWSAEEYHQQYYDKHQSKPYCHIPIKRF